MRGRDRLTTLGLLVGGLAIVPLAAPRTASTHAKPLPRLVVISIDGLRPDYVLEADRYGLRVPELRRLLREGAHASGVVGVLPTVTYPSHTTLVTGVSPARHGILSNHPFDPGGQNQGGWYWYAEDIRVPTLWDAAADHGFVTSSVDWPVTVGARISYNIPQYWRTATAEDAKLERAVSTPGLVPEAEAALGPYPSAGAENVEDDARRAAFNAFLLERKRPQLHFGYLTSLDHVQHETGPGSPESLAALERLDALVGRIRAAAERAGEERPTIAVVSDHGFTRTSRELRLNAALRQAGLIDADPWGNLISWKAFAWSSGGSAALLLRDPHDDQTRRTLARVLDGLAAQPESGVDRVLDPSDAALAGGFPEAAFVIGARPGYRFEDGLAGPVTRPGWPCGVHGLLREQREMDATFLVAGPGIPAGRDLGRVDMRDVAPTLAARLGLSLPQAEGRDLLR